MKQHAPPYPETTLKRDPAKELVRLRARHIALSKRYAMWLEGERATRDEEGLAWLAVDAREKRWELGITELEEDIERLHESLQGDERI